MVRTKFTVALLFYAAGDSLLIFAATLGFRIHGVSSLGAKYGAAKINFRSLSIASSLSVNDEKGELEVNNVFALFSSCFFSCRSTCALTDASTAHPVLNPFYKGLASPAPLGPHINIKGKIINAWGILYAGVIAAVAAVVLPLMAVAAVFADVTGNGAVSKLWCCLQV